jgi:hypothetical protein
LRNWHKNEIIKIVQKWLINIVITAAYAKDGTQK